MLPGRPSVPLAQCVPIEAGQGLEPPGAVAPPLAHALHSPNLGSAVLPWYPVQDWVILASFCSQEKRSRPPLTVADCGPKDNEGYKPQLFL